MFIADNEMASVNKYPPPVRTDVSTINPLDC